MFYGLKICMICIFPDLQPFGSRRGRYVDNIVCSPVLCMTREDGEGVSANVHG